MTALVLSLRRTLRRRSAVLLLLCPLLILLAGRLPQAEATPLAGLVIGQESPTAERLVQELLRHDFILAEDEESLYALVERGELNCGMILPADLEERLARGDIEGCIRFIESPGSYAPELYKNMAAAALYREYAPYITADAFENTTVTREEVLDEYHRLIEAGNSFVLDIRTVPGTPAPHDIRQQRLVMGCAALLACALILTTLAELYQYDYHPLLHRLGLRSATLRILLPGCGVSMLLTFVSIGIGTVLAGYPALLLTLLLYCLMMTGLGLLLASLVPGVRQTYMLLPLLLIAAAAVCPIYTDPALFSPALEGIRRLLPVYWFWLIDSRPLLWVFPAAAAVLLGFGSVFLRSVVFERLQFRLSLQ